jgi:hypothetical protein
MATHLSDEDVLAHHLMDLRGEARTYQLTAKDETRPHVKAHLEGVAEHNFNVARALHRALEKLGVKGIGPLDY